MVFLLVGGLDVALAWYPLNLGNPEWEFGTISATFDRLPLVTMGLIFLVGSGVARGTRWLVRGVALVMVVAGVTILLAAILYATDVPLALDAAPNPVVQLGLRRAIAKTAGQGVLYPVAYVWVGIRAWRHVNS